jgi:hypothetical protein
MIDRTGLHTQSAFVNQSSKSKILFKCRLHDSPLRKHGKAPSHKAVVFTPRPDATTYMCNCSAKIYVYSKTGVSYFTMHLMHTGHTPNSPEDLRGLPLRYEVKEEIYKAAKITTNYGALRRHAKSYVNDTLKPELGLATPTMAEEAVVKEVDGDTQEEVQAEVFVDRRFNPTDDDIKNTLQRRAGANRLSSIDQEDTILQLCSEPNLTWAFRPHSRGHVSFLHLPKKGLYAVGTNADLTMNTRLISEQWDGKRFQDGMRDYLQASSMPANEKVRVDQP